MIPVSLVIPNSATSLCLVQKRTEIEQKYEVWCSQARYLYGFLSNTFRERLYKVYKGLRVDCPAYDHEVIQ